MIAFHFANGMMSFDWDILYLDGHGIGVVDKLFGDKVRSCVHGYQISNLAALHTCLSTWIAMCPIWL